MVWILNVNYNWSMVSKGNHRPIIAHIGYPTESIPELPVQKFLSTAVSSERFVTFWCSWQWSSNMWSQIIPNSKERTVEPVLLMPCVCPPSGNPFTRVSHLPTPLLLQGSSRWEILGTRLTLWNFRSREENRYFLIIQVLKNDWSMVKINGAQRYQDFKSRA